MKFAVEGKMVFSASRCTVVSSTKNEKHTIPGEKDIVFVPISGVSLDGRTLVFGEAAVVLIEERDNCVVVDSLLSRKDTLIKAIEDDPKTETIMSAVIDFLDKVPDGGELSKLIVNLRSMFLFLGNVDFAGAFSEMYQILKEKYPTQIDAILARMSQEDVENLAHLLGRSRK